MKAYHFQAKWKNGDKLTICSYGKNKKDAFIRILLAKKQGKFVHNKNDYFRVSNVTEEETYTKLRRKGFSKNYANIFSKYGHTGYIVKNGKVEIN